MNLARAIAQGAALSLSVGLSTKGRPVKPPADLDYRGQILRLSGPGSCGWLPAQGQALRPGRREVLELLRPAVPGAGALGALTGRRAVSDLLDLQTYLVSTRNEEGRDSVYQLTGDTSALVMDSHGLAQEIDRQRQVLQEAISSGFDFQDSRVREISERLDRLIVVMQRFLGHRGAVP